MQCLSSERFNTLVSCIPLPASLLCFLIQECGRAVMLLLSSQKHLLAEKQKWCQQWQRKVGGGKNTFVICLVWLGFKVQRLKITKVNYCLQIHDCVCGVRVVSWSDLPCGHRTCQTVCCELLSMASHPSALVCCPVNPPTPALWQGPVQAARTTQGLQGRKSWQLSPRLVAFLQGSQSDVSLLSFPGRSVNKIHSQLQTSSHTLCIQLIGLFSFFGLCRWKYATWLSKICREK